MRALRRFRSCRAGSTAVEFAIICTVLVLVTFGVIEFGRGLNVRNQLSQAADYGARRILTDHLISDSALESVVRSAFTAGAPDMLTVTVGAETVSPIEQDLPRLQIAGIAIMVPGQPARIGLGFALSSRRLGLMRFDSSLKPSS